MSISINCEFQISFCRWTRIFLATVGACNARFCFCMHKCVWNEHYSSGKSDFPIVFQIYFRKCGLNEWTKMRIISIITIIHQSFTNLFIAALFVIWKLCRIKNSSHVLLQIYPEEKIRSQAIGIVLGSMALGVLLGYPFGGILYAFSGKSAPFYIIAFLTFLVLGKIQFLCHQNAKNIWK